MFYKLLKAIVRPIAHVFVWVKTINKENAKYDGKMIIISNHINMRDPIWIHLTVKPKVYFMAKKELFKNFFLRKIITAFGAFPVSRGTGDLGAFKSAFDLLNNGKTIAIFPEGTRNKTGELRRFHPGAAMIALRTNTPVLPILIDRPLRPFHRTNIIVGKPIDLNALVSSEGVSETDQVKLATKHLYNTMLEMQRGNL